MISILGLVMSAAVVQDPPARDSMERARTTALPLVSYSDATGMQFGGTVVHGFRVGADPATRASSLSLYAAGTAKGHAKAYLQLDRWSAGNAARWRARVEHISYPLPFFGIGSSTPDSAEEWYSSGVTTVQLFTQHGVRPSMFVHAGMRHVRSRLRESEPGGALDLGAIPGSSGSDVLMTELGVVIDSRDHAGSARGGTFARVIPSVSMKALGSDQAFQRLTIDARRYFALGGGVAAFQVQFDGLAGSAPFDLLPMIGADTAMRGYPRGRFRDRHAMTAQAEFRSSYWRRVGAVAFAGAGTVTRSLSRLASDTWYPGVGAGLRYVLSPRNRFVLRADLGIGRGSFGVSLGIGEAF